MKKSTISLQVALDEQKMPERILWQSDDSESASPTEAKAFLLSIFEKESLDTLKMDIWTKDMMVEEMQLFFYHSLRAMGDTYHRATRDTALANDFQKFVQYFGEEAGVIKSTDSD